MAGHRAPRERRLSAPNRPRGLRRDERGQILPALMVLLASLLALGLMLFQVGRAADIRSSAQTAADAAALAGAREVQHELYELDGPAGFNVAAVRAAAADYAQRNGSELTYFSLEGLDVAVKVRTQATLGQDAKRVDAQNARGTARARATVTLGSVGAAPGGVQDIPSAPPGKGGRIDAMWREASRIDALHTPYVYGGAHGTPASPNGPFDCSSAVSRILQSVGYRIPTMTADQFMTWGKPGPGEVTIWASPGHVFMSINGRGFGTSDSNPGGGAGWLPYSTPQYGGFVAVHPPDVKGTFIPGIIGSGLVSGSAGTPTTVELVSWDHTSSLSAFAGAVPVTASAIEVARAIYRVGKAMHVTDRMMLEAFEAALDESSMGQNTCCDHDSVGVFQQRGSWGPTAVRADPAGSARLFFDALFNQSQSGSPGTVTWRVQQPAGGPWLYDRYEDQAREWIARVERQLSA